MQFRSIKYFKIKKINKEYYSNLAFGILTYVMQQEIITSQPIPRYIKGGITSSKEMLFHKHKLNSDILKFEKNKQVADVIMNAALMTIDLLKEKEDAINKITK